MKRLMLLELQNWYASTTRRPLLLRGARQVGKTHLVRELAKQFRGFIEINFEKQPELKKIFELNLDPKRIVRELSLLLGIKIIPGKCLFFLDEIQSSPQAILALRYFYEELPELHVIAAGSLVDFAIEKVGIPVGRVTFRYLYPLSFIEFLVAIDQQLLAQEIVEHDPKVPLNEIIHNKLLRYLAEYFAIGGMPSVVQQWVNSQNIRTCQELQTIIVTTYEEDFAKYAKHNQIKYVDLLYKQIPKYISKHFKFGQLTAEYRKRELEPALNLLRKAGICHFIYHSQAQGLPLAAQANFDKYKIIMLDIALTQVILGADIKDLFLDPETSLINKGEIAEAFIGQELLTYADPKNQQELYYWQDDGKAEVDYLMIKQNKIIPVEVKSGRGSHLRSIRIFLDAHLKSDYGIRFSIYNYSFFENMYSYPLYAVAGAIADKERLLEFLK